MPKKTNQNNNARRVTIKDVARRAGVTHPTVSRAIHDSDRVSEATKERVREAIAELGYRPNLIARSLVNSRSRTIGLIVPELNPHVLPVVKGVAETCRSANYAMMLFTTSYWEEEGQAFFDIVDNWRVDGILIYNVVYHRRYRDEIKQDRDARIPFVFVNKYLHEKRVNAVGVDNGEAISMLMKHLVELGHTQIGMLNGNLRSVDGQERSDGFEAALKVHRLTYHKSYCGTANYSEDQARAEMKQILSYKRRPTAMICANDLMAVGAVKAIEDAGLRVPEDISVTGFDDIPDVRFFKPSLTTIRPPHQEAGIQGIHLLLELIEGKSPRKYRQLIVPPELIIRYSTGPAPSRRS